MEQEKIYYVLANFVDGQLDRLRTYETSEGRDAGWTSAFERTERMGPGHRCWIVCFSLLGELSRERLREMAEELAASHG